MLHCVVLLQKYAWNCFGVEIKWISFNVLCVAMIWYWALLTMISLKKDNFMLCIWFCRLLSSTFTDPNIQTLDLSFLLLFLLKTSSNILHCLNYLRTKKDFKNIMFVVLFQFLLTCNSPNLSIFAIYFRLNPPPPFFFCFSLLLSVIGCILLWALIK